MMAYDSSIVDVPESVDWRSLETAPKDGSVFAVRYRPWDNPNADFAVQCVWWFNGAFRPAFYRESSAYAESWAPLAEVSAAAIREYT